jgi:glycosyltransferase involved in cell wall biosynthesis
MSIDNYSGVTLSRNSGIPLILEYNGSEAWAAKNWGKPLRFHDLAVMAEEVCLRHAHLIVTISEVLRDELIDRGISPDRIVCYPNCIDPEVFDPARFSVEECDTLRRKYNIRGSKVVTFIGTFGRWHGVEKLAEAISTMMEKCPEWIEKNKVKFLVIGDGMMMHEVRRILAPAVQKGIAIMTGLIPQTEAPLHLAASDILVSPHVENADKSRFFGSPTKLFEYMAMGKGIVASDLEQIGEVLKNSLRADSLPSAEPAGSEDKLAVLTRPGDVAELIRSIKFLVEREDWVSTLGRNVRLEALSRYTWVRHVDAILSGFDSVNGRTRLSSSLCLRSA